MTADNEVDNVDHNHEGMINVQTTPSLSPEIVLNETCLQIDHDGVDDNAIGIANGINSHLLSRIDSVHQVNPQNTTSCYKN